MLAVLLLALAIPLTLIVLGGREIFKPSRPAPEIPELRASLEAAASKAMPPPAELGGGRRFVISKGQDAAASRALIEKTAAGLGGGVVVASPVENGGGIRLIVRIPSDAAARFEATALEGTCNLQSDSASTEGLYEIILPEP